MSGHRVATATVSVASITSCSMACLRAVVLSLKHAGALLSLPQMLAAAAAGVDRRTTV